MSDIADRYRRHADGFERKVKAVRPEQWANQSPCEAWDARGVVEHIVVMHGVMLRSSTAPSARRLRSRTTRSPRSERPAPTSTPCSTIARSPAASATRSTAA